MAKYRIKEASTDRVWHQFPSAVDAGDELACQMLLSRQISLKRLIHPNGLVLQVWDARRGWVDTGATSS